MVSTPLRHYISVAHSLITVLCLCRYGVNIEIQRKVIPGSAAGYERVEFYVSDSSTSTGRG